MTTLTGPVPDTEQAALYIASRSHPRAIVGGDPGLHWVACDCGWYVTGKPSVRDAKRSFATHRRNYLTAAITEARRG